MRSITVLLKNVLPTSDEVDREVLIDFWTSVEQYFHRSVVETSRNGEIRLSVAADDIKRMLKSTDSAHIDAFMERLHLNVQLGKLPESPFAAKFEVGVLEGSFASNAEFDAFVVRFVETLFLAMNISIRDGCDFGFISVVENGGRSIDLRGLSNYAIEGAWHLSDQGKWPTLRPLDFPETWEWLVRNRALGYVLADTAAVKAIAVLTELSYADTPRLTDIVQVSHVLESFLLSRDEPRSRGIKRKIEVVLGSTAEASGWATEFYKLRSKIVHGDYPIFYPRYFNNDDDFEELSAHYWEVNRMLLQSVAVVIGLIQDLIISRCSEYRFEEKLKLMRL